MELTADVPLMIIAAIVITVIFGALKHLTRSSAGDELDSTREANARLSRIEDQAHVANGDHQLAESLLPSQDEAMILPLGAPMERKNATFEGSLSDARSLVAKMSSDDRRHVAIWTLGNIFSADQLLAEPPRHEHDPLPPKGSG